jgi:hypothetical protein
MNTARRDAMEKRIRSLVFQIFDLMNKDIDNLKEGETPAEHIPALAWVMCTAAHEFGLSEDEITKLVRVTYKSVEEGEQDAVEH